MREACSMISWKLRPSFRQVLDFGSEQARERIVEQVLLNQSKCEVKSFPSFICIRIPMEDRHFWSPRLNISLEEDESGHTHVRGTFGPNANVWTLYLYGYLLTGSVGIFSGLFGACQLSLGMPAWGMWVFTGMLAIALAMLLASRVGQRLAAPQSKILEKIYVDAVRQEVDIR